MHTVGEVHNFKAIRSACRQKKYNIESENASAGGRGGRLRRRLVFQLPLRTIPRLLILSGRGYPLYATIIIFIAEPTHNGTEFPVRWGCAGNIQLF